MRIKEVEQATGLTAKAIRMYESKGLLTVAREAENAYRDYTDEDVARLKTIAILRRLEEMSAPYGTKFVIKDGIAEVVL